jgi:hypothetical protein
MVDLIRMLLVLFVATAPSSVETTTRSHAGLRLVYDFYIGGFRAAELELFASLSPEIYEAAAQFRTAGIVGFFRDTVMKAEASGRILADALHPTRYALTEREEGEEQTIGISFAAGVPSSVEAVPEFRTRPWSINPSDQSGTIDPLSALLIVLLPRPASTVCDMRVEAFDGRRRFAFDIGPAKHKGSYLVCEGAYLRLAGFKPKTLRTRPQETFLVYLEPREDQSFQIKQLVSDGSFGAVVMRLR